MDLREAEILDNIAFSQEQQARDTISYRLLKEREKNGIETTLAVFSLDAEPKDKTSYIRSGKIQMFPELRQPVVLSRQGGSNYALSIPKSVEED